MSNKILNEIQLDFNDVLIKPKPSILSSRSEVNLETTYTFKWSKKTWTGIPIIVANMSAIASFEMAKKTAEQHMMTALHKHYSAEELINFFNSNPNINEYTFYSLGISDKDLAKFNEVKSKTEIKFVCLDVANGYMNKFVDFIKQFRKDNSEITILAGNVVDGEMAHHLIMAGADIAKIGIGSSGLCITRLKAGVGRPQLSAVLDCVNAADMIGGLVCSDGGCNTPADFAKAFAAGADFVMAGSIFSGHKECGGEITNTITKLKDEVTYTIDKKTNIWTYKLNDIEMSIKTENDKLPEDFFEFVPTEASTMRVYGMSSEEAMKKHNGGMDKYRSSEGRSVDVKYKGEVINTIQDILGGIRSSCTYTNSSNLSELEQNSRFYRVNNTHNRIFEK